MNVHFGQIYVTPGVSFTFSHNFQLYLSKEVSARISPSPAFIEKFGEDFELMFRISAKRIIEDIEICGPTVYRKTKDVEYTLFLPFSVIHEADDPRLTAIDYILNGTVLVCEALGFDCAEVRKRRPAIIEHVLARPEMFKIDA